MPGIVVRPPATDDLVSVLLADMERVRAERDKLRVDRNYLLDVVRAAWELADYHKGQPDPQVCRNILVRLANLASEAIAEVQRS